VDAVFCVHCGEQLGTHSTKFVAVVPNEQNNASAMPVTADLFIDIEKIPEDGVGIHIAGETKPLYVSIPLELIVGRYKKEEESSEAFLDLTDFHASSMGISRRHVLIKRTTSGYEVTDLASTNGSWLNAERLIPNKAYPFASGSQLRIGNMRMLIMFRS